jgi:hypothetical protein
MAGPVDGTLFEAIAPGFEGLPQLAETLAKAGGILALGPVEEMGELG